MWIRTQSNKLLNLDKMVSIGISGRDVRVQYKKFDLQLGRYENEERAEQELNLLVRAINNGDKAYLMPDLEEDESYYNFNHRLIYGTPILTGELSPLFKDEEE